jgi:hypothetical protein
VGVRQGECHVCQRPGIWIEKNNGNAGVDAGYLKLLLLLYAVDAAIISKTRNGLQVALGQLLKHCEPWKLMPNTDKTKVVIFRMVADLFMYDGNYVREM